MEHFIFPFIEKCFSPALKRKPGQFCLISYEYDVKRMSFFPLWESNISIDYV